MNASRLENLNLAAVADRLLRDIRSAVPPDEPGKGESDPSRRVLETDSARSVSGFVASFRGNFDAEKRRLLEARAARRAAKKDRIAARIQMLEQTDGDTFAEEELEEGTYAVVGRVTDVSGKPLSGVRVHARDRDIGFDDDLGEDVTGAAGRYRIEFGPEKFHEPGEGNPEVYVTILNAAGEVAETSPKWSLGRERNLYTIDVKVDAQAIPGVVAMGDLHSQLTSKQLKFLAQRQTDLAKRTA